MRRWDQSLLWAAAMSVCAATASLRAAEGPKTHPARPDQPADVARPVAETSPHTPVNRIHDLVCTAWTLEKRSRTTTIKKRMPRHEQRTHTYTVMVPQQHQQTVTYTTAAVAPRIRTITTRVKVPVFQDLEKTTTVLVPVREARTYTETIRVPIEEAIDETYTVRVPVTEDVTTMRTIHRRVPVQTRQTVVCHGGSWTTETVSVPMTGGADGSPQTVTRRRWVPSTSTREVTATVWQCPQEEVPFTRRVTTHREEKRTRTRFVRRWRTEQRTRTCLVTTMVPDVRTTMVRGRTWAWETRTRKVRVAGQPAQRRTETISRTVMVPAERTRTATVAVWDTTTETKTETYWMRVPHLVTRQIPEPTTAATPTAGIHHEAAARPPGPSRGLQPLAAANSVNGDARSIPLPWRLSDALLAAEK